MIFTVELHTPLQLTKYRLQHNGEWRNISDNIDLTDSDFTTNDHHEVKSKSNLKGKAIILENTKYDIEPMMYRIVSNRVYYNSLIFRKKYPCSSEKLNPVKKNILKTEFFIILSLFDRPFLS